MKKYIQIIFIILTLFLTQACHAFSFKGEYSNQNMAKYYPQSSYNYRYPRQKTYVYSSQQARYYGYTTPQTQSYQYSYSKKY